MGRIGAPHGVKGWVRVQPYTSDPESLCGFPVWLVGGGDAWMQRKLEECRPHGGGLIAKFEACDDRDAAQALGLKEVAVHREWLPEPSQGEYYWVDLVGLSVVNLDGLDLGRVSDVLRTGANDVLQVTGDRERLIPFVEAWVRQVDLEGGVIRVDWQPDY